MMPSSMTKIKKTVKSIKRFIKALTKSKSRTSKKDRKEAKKLRDIEEQRNHLDLVTSSEVSPPVLDSSTSKGGAGGESSGCNMSNTPAFHKWARSLESPNSPQEAAINASLGTEVHIHKKNPLIGKNLISSDASNNMENWNDFIDTSLDQDSVEIIEVDDSLHVTVDSTSTKQNNKDEVDVCYIKTNVFPPNELSVIIEAGEDGCDMPVQAEPFIICEDFIQTEPFIVCEDFVQYDDQTDEDKNSTSNDIPVHVMTLVPSTNIAELPTEDLPVKMTTPPTSKLELPTEDLPVKMTTPPTSKAELPTKDLPVAIKATHEPIEMESSSTRRDEDQSKDKPATTNLSTTVDQILSSDVHVEELDLQKVVEGGNTPQSSLSGLPEPAMCVITSRCSYNPLHELTDDVFASKISSQKILLESCTPNNAGDSLIAYICVANLSYTKNVYAHVSTDSWKKVTNIPATYVSSDGSNSTDQFMLELPSNVDEFALCFEADDESFWDNNNGKNYAVIH